MRYNSDSSDIIEIFEILWKSVINYLNLRENAEIHEIFAEIREILLKIVRYYRIYDLISHKFPQYLTIFTNIPRVSVLSDEF